MVTIFTILYLNELTSLLSDTSIFMKADMSRMSAYDVWYSEVADLPDYPYRFTMWQYSQSATVDGVAGYVDLNVSFIDYSEK